MAELAKSKTSILDLRPLHPATSVSAVADLVGNDTPATLNDHIASIVKRSVLGSMAEAHPKSSHPRAKLPVAVIALIGAGLVLSIAAGVFAYTKLHTKPKVIPPTKVETPKPQPQTPVVVPEPAKPTTQASPLTGAEVDIATANRRITGVVIENHTDARPQSGLSQAGVVYEALAEGGITRFLAFFLEQRPVQLGPIRSLRTYFIDWAKEYNAPVAHVGGNADALDLVGPAALRDMNQFYNSAYFFRTKDRYAPHNMYSTSDLLDSLEDKLNFTNPTNFTPTPRKQDTPQNPASHPKITLNYSYAGYQAEYQYYASSNSYLRFVAGQPHIDRNTGNQITVKNVVVEYMPTSYGSTRIGEQTVIMGTIGSGKALVFIDGGVVEGTWRKTSRDSRTQILDSSGTEITLNKGNTWYNIMPIGKLATY